MKNIKFLFSYVLLISVVFTGCKKDEISEFQADAAVNFIQIDKAYSVQYSFLGNSEDEYIQEIPVRIIGDTTGNDRQFSAVVVKDSITTAPESQYEILGGVIEAGKFEGKLTVKLLNSDALNTSRVSIKLKLAGSEDFKAGNVESSEFVVTWTNQVIVPSWSYYRYYFTSVASTAAYRLIVQTTGLTTLTATQHNREIGALGVEALGTQFGDYVKQWNLDHPDQLLRHDDGTQAGQLINPLYYTRSKYD